MWNEVVPEDSLAREKELRDGCLFFKSILEKGAMMVRHDNTPTSARRILELQAILEELKLALDDRDEGARKDLEELRNQYEGEIKEANRRWHQLSVRFEKERKVASVEVAKLKEMLYESVRDHQRAREELHQIAIQQDEENNKRIQELLKKAFVSLQKIESSLDRKSQAETSVQELQSTVKHLVSLSGNVPSHSQNIKSGYLLREGVVCKTCKLAIQGLYFRCLDCDGKCCDSAGALVLPNAKHCLWFGARYYNNFYFCSVCMSSPVMREQHSVIHTLWPMIGSDGRGDEEEASFDRLRSCSSCFEWITGVRYACLKCTDINYCSDCRSKPMNAARMQRHPFLPLKASDSPHKFLDAQAELPSKFWGRFDCDSCGKTITCTRMKCLDCDSLDWCESCAVSPSIRSQHPVSHVFWPIAMKNDYTSCVYNCSGVGN
ncbi:hypothetical protein ABKN59_008665 [Abortiporus biennis]